MKRVSNHEDSVLKMLREDQDFAIEYLSAALEEIDEEGGEAVFLQAVRRIIEARLGFTELARTTGLSRTNLYRQFDTGGNPGLHTLRTVLSALGIGLSQLVGHSQTA
ncbi:helix-turn-helix domain-containing transcriptional regulator [Pseudomonas flexibilis]|uniref:Probable addiction module antidote protein n=1 Tax=Pseudomonas flexibilis TaxID=706570 RepID=A0A1N6VZ03_9PSED|nr:DNA-binding protein [Pseudomonas flexibilis]SIQ83050.1 probable addiction module antidote protein [Pseudomonas flexibilis]